MVAYLAMLLAFFVVGVPARAAVDLPTVTQWVWGVVDSAQAQNNQTLNQFVADAVAASTEDELQAARSRAHGRLDAIWDDANGQLDALLALFPVELASVVASARSELTSDHNAAHAEVDDLFYEIMANLPPTTTTTTKPPTTTTTTKPGTTTTTTKPPTSTTTTTPASGTTTTTVPGSTTTTTPDRDTTTTTTRPDDEVTTTTTPSVDTDDERDSGVVPIDTGAGDPPATVDDDLIGTGDPANDPSPAFSIVSEEDASKRDSMLHDAMEKMGAVSSMISAGAAVVLPDGVADIALAPIVLIEFLLTTMFDSFQSVLVPLVMLMAAVIVFAWREMRDGGLLTRSQPPA